MHPEVIQWVSQWATDEPVSILDIGGRNLNGSTRDLFPNADYVSLDLRPGNGVDIVADATVWDPDRQYDIVLSTEVFEHTTEWPAIVSTAYKACKAGGFVVFTCAGPGRAPHSGIEATPITPGEHYQNVSPTELANVMTGAGFSNVRAERLRLDTRAHATKE